MATPTTPPTDLEVPQVSSGINGTGMGGELFFSGFSVGLQLIFSFV
jgi:hypothetical protein